MRRAVLAISILAIASPACAAGKGQSVASVAMALDEVHTLTFKSPVATVYVGNPAIADVTMVDARHAFVQGKGYGRTNVVALNRDNVQIFNTKILVVGSEGSGTVFLNRGAQRVTLACVSGHCEPTPTPGDDPKDYDIANTEQGAHQSAARGMAAAQAPRN
jgi:Pilus formation protein N terminal region